MRGTSWVAQRYGSSTFSSATRARESRSAQQSLRCIHRGHNQSRRPTPDPAEHTPDMAASGCERSVITSPIDDCFEEESPLGDLSTLAFARPSTRDVENHTFSIVSTLVAAQSPGFAGNVQPEHPRTVVEVCLVVSGLRVVPVLHAPSVIGVILGLGGFALDGDDQRVAS